MSGETSKIDAMTAMLLGSQGNDTMANMLMRQFQPKPDRGAQLASMVGQLGAGAALYGEDRNKAIMRHTAGLAGQPTMEQQQAGAIQDIRKTREAAAVKAQQETAKQIEEMGYPEVASAVRAGGISSEKAMEMISPINRSTIAYREETARIDQARLNNQITDSQASLAYNNANLALQERRVQAEEERLKLQRVQNSQLAKELPAAVRTELANRSMQQSESISTVRQMNVLANRYENATIQAGSRAKGGELFRQVVGSQNEEDLLRTTYRDLRNKFTLANLPPGAASDNDVRLAMEGWPPDNADPEHIAGFLRGQAKLQAIDTAMQDEQIKFIQRNKGTVAVDAEGNETTFLEKQPSLYEDPAFIEKVERISGVKFAQEGDDNYFDADAQQALIDRRDQLANRLLNNNTSAPSGARRRQSRGN